MTVFSVRPAAWIAHAAALSGLLTTACSDVPESLATSTGSVAAAVTGGRLVDEGEFPAVVALGGCTGTLVRPDLVVYAAHCGTAISSVRFGPDSDAPERVVNTERCRSFPNARLGDGTDLAYCVLAEAVSAVEPERILAGCELDDFRAGEAATIVGYGKDNDASVYGQKRVATSRIERIGEEIFLESGAGDTCRGDSGGPVFIERLQPDGTLQRRLVGVTSAGTESECGRGLAHYVNITRKLAWLETSSQLDLSPCFDAGSWAPTAACQAATCGERFEQPADFEPPSVVWTAPAEGSLHLPLKAGAEFVELELAVEAADAGWGVEHVALALLTTDGAVLFERRDGVPPYALARLRVPPGQFLLRAEARDFAGNTSEALVAVRVGEDAPASWAGGGGCASLTRAAPCVRDIGWSFFLLVLCAARRLRCARVAMAAS
jgi:hypothetical protein